MPRTPRGATVRWPTTWSNEDHSYTSNRYRPAMRPCRSHRIECLRHFFSEVPEVPLIVSIASVSSAYCFLRHSTPILEHVHNTFSDVKLFKVPLVCFSQTLTLVPFQLCNHTASAALCFLSQGHTNLRMRSQSPRPSKIASSVVTSDTTSCVTTPPEE